jgi:DNA-binding NarL/FixJ family response regulator
LLYWEKNEDPFQGDHPMNQKIRILIVDDNLSFCRGMQALIKIQPDMQEIGIATRGRKAVEMVETLKPDLVLLDGQMPDLDGITVARKIKSRWPKVKVLLLTMYANYRTKSINAGADAFMTKGLPPEHILALIRGMMINKNINPVYKKREFSNKLD